MKAIQLEQFGIEHLQPTEIPAPVIGENEVLVKTTAVALEYHSNYRFVSFSISRFLSKGLFVNGYTS